MRTRATTLAYDTYDLYAWAAQIFEIFSVVRVGLVNQVYRVLCLVPLLGVKAQRLRFHGAGVGPSPTENMVNCQRRELLSSG